MMTIPQAFILATIQGLTEFLPISSSGHLIIIPNLFNWHLQPLVFDVVVHLGTLVAVVFYFRKDLWGIIQSAVFFKNPLYAQERRLLLPLLVGIVPTAVVGFFLDDYIENFARTANIVAFNLLLWGVFLILADWYGKKTKSTAQKFFTRITIFQSCIIGIFQIFSLFPGTSRSGVTIGAGIFAKLSKIEAARFSFLMSVPLIFGAGALKVKDLVSEQTFVIGTLPLILGFLTSAIVGWLAISLLMKALKHFGLTIFGIYRIVLSIGLLIVL